MFDHGQRRQVRRAYSESIFSSHQRYYMLDRLWAVWQAGVFGCLRVFSGHSAAKTRTRMSEWGIGASVPGKEDEPFLSGRGQYVADFRVPGMHEVAFVRSPVAHARIHGVRVPD